ncbi:hypothetical protein CIRG_02545 [Coccidioides immitis RMSCC 2394]|uniref:UMTA protein n=1 Tax=Coccidioides immitis RMSCC 2394 TaxID=404692 RepID=A0A0J6Y838_COCIT|nr:hypothetical protein CIRG_02545 [Coccidioides immitis RMSCC 2394]
MSLFKSYDDDRDSTLGEDIYPETETLRSSIMDYQYENGRRYHAYHSGSYWGPNDEKAKWHADLGHYLYKLLLRGKLYLAPIPKNPQRVIDIGTGTGIWAIEFADRHPSSAVTGTDLSPIQPTLVPPNLSFEIDDCCDEWLYALESFDFIHVRGLYGSVSDWDEFYVRAINHLKPGGYIEQAELSVNAKSDDHSTDGTVMEEWARAFFDAGDALCKSFRTVDEAKSKIIAAGFEDVTEHRFKCPIGEWPENPRLKELGKVMRLYLEEGVEDCSARLLPEVLMWSTEQVKDIQDRMRKALRDNAIHSYCEISVVHGRKPCRD